jgi:hypothetical protein
MRAEGLSPDIIDARRLPPREVREKQSPSRGTPWRAARTGHLRGPRPTMASGASRQGMTSDFRRQASCVHQTVGKWDDCSVHQLSGMARWPRNYRLKHREARCRTRAPSAAILGTIQKFTVQKDILISGRSKRPRFVPAGDRHRQRPIPRRDGDPRGRLVRGDKADARESRSGRPRARAGFVAASVNYLP